MSGSDVTNIGLLLNLIATVGAYIRLRVQLEHRLTKLEAHVLGGVVPKFKQRGTAG